MISYSLENYEDKLIHQVIHLDQGVWYNPEYRADKAVRRYPSRMLQLAWSVHRGYLKPSKHIEDVLFGSILSRQGERWQCFGEDPEDLTDCVILCREMMMKKGFGGEYADALLERVKKNGGHATRISGDDARKWSESVPTDRSSRDFLLVDDATAAFASDFAAKAGDCLRRAGKTFIPVIEPTFAGFEFFALGMIEEGKRHAKAMIEHLGEMNVRAITALSGQAEYMFKVYLPKIGLNHGFEVNNILEYCGPLNIKAPSYVHAGSFNLRYLGKAPSIAELTANEKETPVRNSPEFSPLLRGDKRVNRISIWEKPLCAEYELVLADEAVTGGIFHDALSGIESSGCKSVLTFEPYSYKKLKEEARGLETRYFLEAL